MTETTRKRFSGAKVREIRLQRGMSLWDVENLLGGLLTSASLSRIENGVTENPRKVTVVLLERALGIDAEKLYEKRVEAT